MTDFQTISIKPLSPIIGAEVIGVDLTEPVREQTFQELHDALMKHLVLFFREQFITLDQQKERMLLLGSRQPEPSWHRHQYISTTPT